MPENAAVAEPLTCLGKCSCCKDKRCQNPRNTNTHMMTRTQAHVGDGSSSISCQLLSRHRSELHFNPIGIPSGRRSVALPSALHCCQCPNLETSEQLTVMHINTSMSHTAEPASVSPQTKKPPKKFSNKKTKQSRQLCTGNSHSARVSVCMCVCDCLPVCLHTSMRASPCMNL